MREEFKSKSFEAFHELEVVPRADFFLYKGSVSFRLGIGIEISSVLMQRREEERAGLGFARKEGAEIDSVGDGLPDAYQQAKCPRAKCIFALLRLRTRRL